MKILYINHEKNLGGASKCLVSIMEEAKKCGNEVYCLTPFQDGDFIDKCKELNINVIVRRFFMCVSKKTNPSILESLLIFMLSYFVNYLMALSVVKTVKNKKIDIIHTNSSVINIGCMISRITHKKHVLHIREYVYEDFGWSFVPNRELVMKYYDMNSTDVIFISKALEKALERNFSHANIHQIYDGVDIAGIEDSFHDMNKIGIVGRILEGKGQMQAIQAIEILVNKYNMKTVQLFIVGTGSKAYEDVLRQYAIEHNIEKNVCFVGYKEDVNTFRQQFGIELFCSNSEGFGRVVIEAMLVGNIVIASDRGAFTEIINSNSVGYLYSYGDSNMLAEKIFECVNNNSNLCVVNAARKMAMENYSEKNNTKSILSLYKNILAEKSE